MLLLVIGIYDPLIAHCEVAGMEALLGIQREVGQIASTKPEPALDPPQVYILHFPVSIKKTGRNPYYLIPHSTNWERYRGS